MGKAPKINRFGIFERDCPTIKGVVNKISGENMLMADEIYEMLEHFHRFVVEAMSSDTHPNIRIPNFGNFYLSASKIRVRIINAILLYRKGMYTYEKTCSIIKRFYPIYKLAHFEELRRGKGISYRHKVKKKSLSRLVNRKVRRDWKNA